MDLGLKGKVAMVAAASQGLGKAIAVEFAREGAKVAICARGPEALDETAAGIARETGADVLAYVADVTDAEQVKGFVETTLARFGSVDICVTNAGGPPSKTFDQTSTEDWHSTVELNLMSTVHFARAVLPHMKERRWGRFLTITSMSVKQPIEGLILSNSVRAAVAGLAKTLSHEYGPYGVLVNNICPGYTATDRLNELADRLATAGSVTPDEIRSRWSTATSLRRVGTPEELAAVVVFLASERASYVTGTSLAVDGGWVKSPL